MMEHSYKFYPEDKLTIVTISGDITLDELIKKTDGYFEDPLFDSNFGGVMDMRQASSHVSKLELYEYAKYIDGTGKVGKAKWAVLSNDPILVALSLIFKRVSRAGRVVEVFSTVGAAARFLENNALHDHLED